MKRPVFLLLTLWVIVCGSATAAPRAAPSRVTLKRFAEVPVEMATGELVEREAPDLVLRSRGLDLEVTRNYRSQREAPGPFGYGWAWNHADRLEFPGDLVVRYVSADGTIPIYPDVCYTGAYARVCLSAPQWRSGNKATGVPDATGGFGNVAHYYGTISTLPPLVAGGWNFQDPGGPSTILQVDLASIGATAYDQDHPQYGVSLRLSAGGSNSLAWGHRAYDMDYVDITGDRPQWTWDQLNALQARLELESYRQNVAMDVVVDTFHVGVTYTRNAGGEFKYQPGTTFELVKTNGEYWILNRNLTRLAFALDGRLLRKSDPCGNTLSFHYDTAARVCRITDAAGQAVRLSYEDPRPEAKVILATDSAGRSVGYAYEGDDLVAVTNVMGQVTCYGYDTAQPAPELKHNLVRRTDPEGHSVFCVYMTTNSSPDRVWIYRDGGVTAGRTNEVHYLYLKGTTYSSMPGLGSIQGVVYNASNDISQVYLREGELADQSSDGVNLVATHSAATVQAMPTSSWMNVESALGAADGLMASCPALAGSGILVLSNWGFRVPGLSNEIVQVVFTLAGSASAPVRLSAGGMVATNWFATNAASVTLNVTGDRSRWSWADLRDLAVRVALPPGATNAPEVRVDSVKVEVKYRHFDPGRDETDAFYFYDLAHNMVSSECGGSVHQFAYDPRGNLASWTDPEGHVRRYEYDPVFNKPVRAWDAAGQVTRMEYDRTGQLVKTTDALGQVATREYDGYGNLVRTTAPDGAVETFTYDPHGLRRIRSRNPRGFETAYDYDAAGNCIRMTGPLGHRRAWAYDAAGRKVREIDEAGVETRFEFDGNGRLTNTVTAAGTAEAASTRTRYDARGKPVQTVDPLGNTETLDYDALGRLVCRTDALGGRTVTQYDLYDRPVRQTDALGGVSQVACDARGNVVRRTDRRGCSESAAFNSNNEPVDETDRVGNRKVTAYDVNGNVLAETVIPVGYPGCPEDESPEPLTTAFKYDALNWVVRKTVGAGRTDARATLTEHDRVGRVIRETGPLGHVKRAAYDACGNLTNSLLLDQAGTIVSQLSWHYDAADRPFMEIRGWGGQLVSNRTEYDARGLKCAQVDPLGRRTEFAYDRHRRLVQTRRPDRTLQETAHDRAGHKVAERESGGATTVYAWDAAGRLTVRISGAGLPDARTNSYAWDGLGRLVLERDPAGSTIGRAYDAEGNLVRETNALGYAKAYACNALGRVTNTVDEAGFSTRQEWDGRGLLCRLTDRLGRVAVSCYDRFGQLVALIDPLGNMARWEYDRAGNVIRETNPCGLVTSTAYDAAGRVTNKTAGVGLAGAQESVFTYDALGFQTGVRNPDGGWETSAYDAAGNRLAVTGPRGFTSRYAYDVMNRQTRVTDALGGTTRTEYDERGNVVASIDPLGGCTRTTYDQYGLKRSQTDVLGAVTRYEYDRLGRLTNTTDAAGATEAWRYDAAGNRVESIDSRGGQSRFDVDPLGRVVHAVDALGGETFTVRDAMGNAVAQRDKRGFTSFTRYDALNRPVRIMDPCSNELVIAYDAMGHKTREAAPSGRVTTWGYDAWGRLVETVVGAGLPEARRTRTAYDSMNRVTGEQDPLGHAVRTEYDLAGNRTNAVDRRGFATSMDYDALDRLACTTDAAGNRSRVRYDKAGRIVEAEDRRGHVTRHAYDAAGHLTGLQDAAGGISSNRYDRMGRKIEDRSPTGLRTLYEYDRAGSLVRRITGAGESDTRVESYEIDLLGRRTRVTDAMGGATAYTYDPNGNVTTVSVYSASGILLRSTTTVYEPRNLPVRSVDPLGNATHAGYDSMGRKTSETDPLGNRTEVEFNRFDEPVCIRDPAGACTVTRYDQCGRVVETVNALGQRTGYAYDANGNRTRIVDDAGYAVLTAYDALNRLSAVNRSMPDLPADLLHRADVNGDGVVDEADIVALDRRLP